MRLAHPLLGLLCFAGALAVVWLWVREQRLRHAAAIEFSDPELLDIVAPKRLGWRRHAGVAGAVLALFLLSIAAARPERVVGVTEETSRVVLVLDTSGSMTAQDIPPTRLEAAASAAREFVDAAPTGSEIAVVSFGSTAEPLIAPTSDKDRLNEVFDRLIAEGATATGEGIYAGLGLLETNGFTDEGPGIGVQRRQGALVLMSDGAANAGRDPVRAAETAERAGVPIYTVAFGTPAGTINGQPVGADEAALQSIAETTKGRFYTATSASELSEVFVSVAKTLRSVLRYDSIAHWFALAGALFLLAGLFISLPHAGRLP